MSRRAWRDPSKHDATEAEARALPSFFTVSLISKTSYNCDDCAEHRREPWVNGSACDAHKETSVRVAGSMEKDRSAADLALKVLRAGGNPEPRYGPGTIGHAQWTYSRKGRRKADWSAYAFAIAGQPASSEVAA
jgi:hypothetical protein